MKSIAANSQVQTVAPLELAEGTSLLDLDTGVGVVVGDPEVNVIDDVVNPQRSWTLLIVSAIALVVIVVSLAIRRSFRVKRNCTDQ